MMTKEKLRKIIGRNIRKERLARMMSIEKLAELMDLSPGFVGLIEHGNRGATTYNLYRLAELFDIDIERFYVNDEYEKSKFSEKRFTNSKRELLINLSNNLTDKELGFLVNAAKLLYKLRESEPEDTDGSASD